MLTCKHLKKMYQKKYVVDDLGFSVKEGEVFALLGSNGARIGYSPETPYFHPFLTGREVLELAALCA